MTFGFPNMNRMFENIVSTRIVTRL
jgi:hypothetical protein